MAHRVMAIWRGPKWRPRMGQMERGVWSTCEAQSLFVREPPLWGFGILANITSDHSFGASRYPSGECLTWG